MNNKLLNILIFTVGAAVGSAVTWKIIKTKYEQLAEEEISSVRKEYVDLMTKMKRKFKADAVDEDATEECDGYYPDDEERDFTKKEQEQIKYYKMTSKYRGSEDNKNNEEGGTGDEDELPFINGPYVISPEDFSNNPPGYNVQPLTYFADGILADDWGVAVDLEETIGEDAVNHFGEYADDIVYVRNERAEIDYEVSRDPRIYSEAFHANPNPYHS